MKLLYAVLSGLAAFLTVVVLVVAGTYLKCLAASVTYDISVVLPIAIKVGAFPGGAIFVLSLIGAPRRFPPK